MYPVAQFMQFLADVTQPLQLTWQGEHLFNVESANVPKGQSAEDTQVFVTVFKKFGVEHDVQIIESVWHVKHEPPQLWQIFPGSA